MKFTDGFWLLREGVTALHATSLQKVEPSGNGFSALVAPKVVEHRDATLNSALFELEFSSPLPDVIGVRVRHHRGGEDSLSFDLNTDNPVTHFLEGDQEVSLTSGALTAKLSKGSSFNLEFLAADKVLTHQRAKSLSIFNDGSAHYLAAQLNLGVGELVYGLGSASPHLPRMVRASISGMPMVERAVSRRIRTFRFISPTVVMASLLITPVRSLSKWPVKRLRKFSSVRRLTIFNTLLSMDLPRLKY